MSSDTLSVKELELLIDVVETHCKTQIVSLHESTLLQNARLKMLKMAMRTKLLNSIEAGKNE